MKRKRNVVLLLLFAIVIGAFTGAYAEKGTIESLNKELKENEKKQNAIKGEKKDLQKEQADLTKEIDELDRKISEAGKELNDVEKELAKISANIEKTRKELKEAEEKIDEKNDTLNSRLRVMYKNGNIGYLEVLLSSANIRDFLSRKDMVQAIVDHDTNLLKYMKEQRQIVEAKERELQVERASQETAKRKIESKKHDLIVATRSKEGRMKDVEKNIKQLEKMEDELIREAKEYVSKIKALQVKTGPYSGGKMGWPVPGHSRISSPFGYRIHPIFKTKKLHTGIDITAPTGTSVVAAADGTVIFAGWLGGYGNAVMVDHGGGIVTLYGHNSSISVGVGTDVSRGQTIAKAGSTGYSTGPHCHFEVRRNGAYEDPIPWLRGN